MMRWCRLILITTFAVGCVSKPSEENVTVLSHESVLDGKYLALKERPRYIRYGPIGSDNQSQALDSGSMSTRLPDNAAGIITVPLEIESIENGSNIASSNAATATWIMQVDGYLIQLHTFKEAASFISYQNSDRGHGIEARSFSWRDESGAVQYAVFHENVYPNFWTANRQLKAVAKTHGLNPNRLWIRDTETLQAQRCAFTQNIARSSWYSYEQDLAAHYCLKQGSS